MPDPGIRFLEIETSKKHGGWAAWAALPDPVRAELMAHELHGKMREHYEFDMRNPAPEKTATRDTSPWAKMRERFTGGGFNIAKGEG